MRENQRVADMAGIGFDANVVREVTPRFKRYLRSLAFPLVALKVYLRGDLPELRLVTGETTHVGQLAVVANGHYYGGDFKVAEEASLTSGELEVVLVEKCRPVSCGPTSLPACWRRGHWTGRELFPARDIRAESSGGRVPVQIDGELWGSLPMFSDRTRGDKGDQAENICKNQDCSWPGVRDTRGGRRPLVTYGTAPARAPLVAYCARPDEAFLGAITCYQKRSASKAITTYRMISSAPSASRVAALLAYLGTTATNPPQ